MPKKVLLAVALTVFAVAGMVGYASAFDEPIPTKISLLKWGGNPRVGKLYKLVSKPVPDASLPACNPSGIPTGGGSVTVTLEGNTLECALPANPWGDPSGGWKILGKCDPGKFKGYKYLNKGAPSGDPCKLVILKPNVIKVLAKSVGGIALPGPPGTNGDVSLSLTVGDGNYCAEAIAPHFKEKADTLIKVKDTPPPPDCGGCDCSAMNEYVFTTGIPAPGATAGTLRNFRCSNDGASACVDDGECDFGPCVNPAGYCSGDFSPCATDSDCKGTCDEIVSGNLPMDLELGTVYMGGGLSGVPPPSVPDGGTFVMSVSGAGSLSLGPTAPGDVGSFHCTKGRTCEDGTTPCVMESDCPGTCLDNCAYGPPLPIPNTGTPATSMCAIRVIGEDASGAAQCNGGETDLTLPLRWRLYLNGDLFRSSTPPDIPGVQPCPLCDYLCQGGTKDRFPCDDDTDCPGGSCGSSTECLGGPNDGDPCTPETSDSTDLGDSQNAYPTSHDCQNNPLQDITSNIGGLPMALNMTTGTVETNAVDRAQGRRNFCGFCCDLTGSGSRCFEGDTSGGCPAASPPADGNAVPCMSDADCQADADEYESCVQRNPGAFSEAGATRITVIGSSDGQCMDDGQPHTANLVSTVCISPVFDSTLDAFFDLPGPGAELAYGKAQLSSPISSVSGAFIETGGLF